MRCLFILFYFIQIQNYKSDASSVYKEHTKINNTTQSNYLINSIDKVAIGDKIKEKNKIKELKSLLKSCFEREIEKPYMWDIFTASNDSLLEFYSYKFFLINNVKFKSYYIKINYEDANYQCILIANETLNVEYNTMIVYEKLDSEEKYLRTCKIKEDNIQLVFKNPNNSVKNLFFKVKEGAILDYYDNQIVNKKWGAKKILNGNVFFEYQLKGKTNNHLKNGYWIEVKYSIDYKKNIIQDGNYIDGLRDGKWNFSPEGPVDMIKKFEKGKFIKQFYL